MNNERSKSDRILTATVLAVVLMCLLCSCHATTRYVPVESVRTEYREVDTTGIHERLRDYFESMYRKDVTSDSVIDRSKETVVLKENGDTARHDKERIVYVSSRREKELEHKLSQRDSIINALRLQIESVKSDTIRIPYPVEKQLTRWESAKMWAGGAALTVTGALILAALIWLIVKLAKARTIWKRKS